ncbi:MAG: DUF192 domain-containing protein, partial [bacterium]|nr:DUF192 domain-containing protein [bacterium]
PLYIGEETFTVEIADNPVTQARGLMFRKSVPDNFGMLFVYDVANYYGFWMKNCFVHLDLIFLNKDKQVVEIFFNVPPCEQEPCKSYAPSIPAQYILELRGNRSKEIGLKEGDSISFILE